MDKEKEKDGQLSPVAEASANLSFIEVDLLVEKAMEIANELEMQLLFRGVKRAASGLELGDNDDSDDAWWSINDSNSSTPTDSSGNDNHENYTVQITTIQVCIILILLS